MAGHLEIAPVCTTKSVPMKETEEFSLLVFHSDGTVSVQTQKGIYFFATAYFHCAILVKALLHEDDSRLKHEISGTMIDGDNPPENVVVVNRELLDEALDADKITSNWPGVVKFFYLLREIMSN